MRTRDTVREPAIRAKMPRCVSTRLFFNCCKTTLRSLADQLMSNPEAAANAGMAQSRQRQKAARTPLEELLEMPLFLSGSEKRVV